MQARPSIDALRQRYASRPPCPRLAYATVRDYCDGAEYFPELANVHNDLKDVQRPWAIKAILNLLPRGSRLLEIGSGEPLVAARLVSLGYEVTVCDPFNGAGNGPTEYEACKQRYPQVNFIRALFVPMIAGQFDKKFDGIFSISVLEHVPEQALAELFEAIRIALVPGGYSIHAVDHVLEGNGDKEHASHFCQVIRLQEQLAGESLPENVVRNDVNHLLQLARGDLETFYLSGHGHNLWRGKTRYEDFPFRKCISLNSIVRVGWAKPSETTLRRSAS